MGYVVDELFAFIATDEDGDEGVMAGVVEGSYYPMVAADLVRIQKFVPLAKVVSEQSGVPFKLKHFQLIGDVSEDYLEQYKELPVADTPADDTRDENQGKRVSDGTRKGNGSDEKSS